MGEVKTSLLSRVISNNTCKKKVRMDLTRITGKSFGRALLLFADVAKRTTTVTRWCLTFFGSHLCSRTMSGQTICRVLVPALGLKVVVFNECSPPNPETWNHRLVQMGWQLSAKMSVTFVTDSRFYEYLSSYSKYNGYNAQNHRKNLLQRVILSAKIWSYRKKAALTWFFEKHDLWN